MFRGNFKKYKLIMSNQEAKSKSFIAFAKIFKSRGVNGIWLHILNIWFDIIRGIDTVERYKSDSIKKTYVTTSQSSISRSIKYAINYLEKNKDLKNLNFVELGAGKGKVIIVLKELILNKFKKHINILAIELDEDLCNIFRKNLIISGFSEENNKNLILKKNINFNKKIKVKLINEDIQSKGSQNQIKEITKFGNTIYYCCDSQTKESLMNLFAQLIKIKDIKSRQNTLFIYSNPRYLSELTSIFRNEVKLIRHEIGSPQKSYAIINIL